MFVVSFLLAAVVSPLTPYSLCYATEAFFFVCILSYAIGLREGHTQAGNQERCVRQRRVVAIVSFCVAFILFLVPGAVAFENMGDSANDVANDTFLRYCLGPIPWILAGIFLLTGFVCLILPDHKS